MKAFASIAVTTLLLITGCGSAGLTIGDGSAASDGWMTPDLSPTATSDAEAPMRPDLFTADDADGGADASVADLGARVDLTTGNGDLARGDGLAEPCGASGARCCDGGTCYGGGCCVGGTCADEGRACGSGLVCSAATCTHCGGTGEPCCDGRSCDRFDDCCCGDDVCVGRGETCSNGFECLGDLGAQTKYPDGSIFACGAQDGSCCPGSNGPFCTAPGFTCVVNGCFRCGDASEPCCDGETCNNDGCCTILLDSYVCVPVGAACGWGVCLSQSCGGCGAIGEPCCPGRICTQQDGTCGSGDTCVPCGGEGQPCCLPNDYCALGRACVAGTCT